MQPIPETASRFNVKDSYDPVQNIKGGLAYLRWLLAYYQGNVALAVAGYNAGRAQWTAIGRTAVQRNQNYVRRILFLPAPRSPLDARVVARRQPCRLSRRRAKTTTAGRVGNPAASFSLAFALQCFFRHRRWPISRNGGAGQTFRCGGGDLHAHAQSPIQVSGYRLCCGRRQAGGHQRARDSVLANSRSPDERLVVALQGLRAGERARR